MSLVISKVFTYDTDAGNYIQAVEGPAGDNQVLEPAVRQAINNFVVGCKQDGIWSAIKASCILAGARTLNGALVPLVGTAPTNNNFVSGTTAPPGTLSESELMSTTYTVTIPADLNAGIIAIGYAESTLEAPVTPEDVVQRYALAAAQKACQDMKVGPYYVGPIPPQFNADGTPYVS